MMSNTEESQRDLQTVIAELTDDLQDAAEKTGDEASRALRRSAVAMRDVAQRLGAEIKDLSDDVVGGAKAHPIATAAIIAAAAALIGLVATRTLDGRH